MDTGSIKRSVRGQAALEYLMTYGWAILVIMVVGVALWQMGLFSQPAIVPGCRGFSQIRPLDSKLTSGGLLTVFIQNEAGTRLNVSTVTATIGLETCSLSSPSTPIHMRPGRTEELNLTCTGSYTLRNYYLANIMIEYANLVSGITHKSTGECWGEVE